jgi:peptide/nickel transport system substrate-binding protein
MRVGATMALQVGALLAALLGGVAPAWGQKSADTLRVSWRDAIPDIDPSHSGLRGALVVAHHVWDTLVYRDPDTLQVKPLLATEWRQLDANTVDFTLRPDVHFHNGDPFTAEDVAYSVKVALDAAPGSRPGGFQPLAGAEVIDPQHVRLHITQALPLVLEYLSIVLPILPRAYRESLGDGFSAAPVGTGPYRVVRIDGAREIELARNDDYFPDSPKGRPAIGHIIFRAVPDATSEITDLLGGRADWIWAFDPDQFDTISRVPGLQAVRADSMRIGYLAMDAAGREGARDPFTDERVRRAVVQAIDREALARQFGAGVTRVLDAPCFPTQFGCDQPAAGHLPYDPTRSRQLLAEAGYPDGFATELVSYVLPQWSNAVQNYLRAVGIDAAVRQLQPAGAADLARAGHVPLLLGTWGSNSINDVAAILPHFFGGGPFDQVRDPELEGLIQQAAGTQDADQRRAAYLAVIRRISAQSFFLPLHVMVATYGFSHELNFHPSSDEIPRFFQATWK